MRKFNKKDYIIETYYEFLEIKYMDETINMFHPNNRNKDDKLLNPAQKAAKTFANNKINFEKGRIRGIANSKRE